MQAKPKISVITASKNGGRFLRETLDSILVQNFTNYEHVFVDSVSTDNTLEILEEYKRKGYDRIRWISEPDRHADEGFYKALMMSQGEYIMFCCVSDGYLDKDWFGKCVDVLDNNPDVSLVYGMPLNIRENGMPRKIVFSKFADQLPPQKMEFFPFWLGTFFVYPEGTYCVRANVYKKCFPKFEPSGCFLQNHGVFSFNYNFNVNGYLPYFLPVIASFGRSHHDSNNRNLIDLNSAMKNQYFAAIKKYHEEVLSGKRKHIFRDGSSNEIEAIGPYELKLDSKKILDYSINREAYLRSEKIRGLRYQKRIPRILVSLFTKKKSNTEYNDWFVRYHEIKNNSKKTSSAKRI